MKQTNSSSLLPVSWIEPTLSRRPDLFTEGRAHLAPGLLPISIYARIGPRLARLLLAFCALAVTAVASAQDMSGRYHLQNAGFFDATYFVELQQGSELSRLASGLRGGGYELSGGATVKFKRWYKTDWVDTRLNWMTLLTPDVGLLFGFSTGERGQKYEIRPSLRLGLLAQRSIGKRTLLSFRASTTVGGQLREKTCTADYGDIGGVQKVNCRLAASTLAPEDTLQYLMNRQPHDRHRIAVMLTRRF